jgi:hypothetical protein
MDNAQSPTGPVLTAAESRRRVLHNMCSSLLYNLSVILFGLKADEEIFGIDRRKLERVKGDVYHVALIFAYLFAYF